MDFALLGLAALRGQARRGCSPPKPARNRLDSRTLVRTPSITGGMGSCGTPRIRKIISAASPGESTLEPMPTPCTPAFFIHSSACGPHRPGWEYLSATDLSSRKTGLQVRLDCHSSLPLPPPGLRDAQAVRVRGHPAP